ncbi:hypothetical protein EDB83DRAFT_1367664 [Lactarius deliciosus]|nr:hypothetical protein EDB83DRAFT_1367664 [Lactarius deliciosus]
MTPPLILRFFPFGLSMAVGCIHEVISFKFEYFCVLSISADDTIHALAELQDFLLMPLQAIICISQPWLWPGGQSESSRMDFRNKTTNLTTK